MTAALETRKPSSIESILKMQKKFSLETRTAQAAYDKWFRAQVHQAEIEANDPNTAWVTNEEANASWATRRAQLIELVKP